MINDIEAAQRNRERLKAWRDIPYPEDVFSRQGSGRLDRGEAGRYKFMPDTGCYKSCSCFNCPLPECRLVVLDKRHDK